MNPQWITVGVTAIAAALGAYNLFVLLQIRLAMLEQKDSILHEAREEFQSVKVCDARMKPLELAPASKIEA